MSMVFILDLLMRTFQSENLNIYSPMKVVCKLMRCSVSSNEYLTRGLRSSNRRLKRFYQTFKSDSGNFNTNFSFFLRSLIGDKSNFSSSNKKEKVWLDSSYFLLNSGKRVL